MLAQSVPWSGKDAASNVTRPARIYVSSEDHAVLDGVRDGVRAILDDVGFRELARFPTVSGSWFQRLFFASRRELSPNQVAASLAKPERSAGVRALDLPQSQVDQNRADGVSRLLTSLESTPSALVQIGSILILKTEGTPVVVNLTPRELSELERNPALFGSPAEAMKALRNLRARQCDRTSIESGG